MAGLIDGSQVESETQRETIMRTGVAIGALAGLAASASAQDFAYEILAPSVVNFATATSFTVTVIASGPGTHIAGGAFGMTIASDPPSGIADVTWTPADWSTINTDGGFNGTDYEPVIFGQLILPDFGFPPAVGSELPAVVGTFTFLIGDASLFLVDLQLVDAGGDFALETFNDADDSFARDGGSIRYGSARIVIPAPASLTLLGLAPVLGRRRR